MIFLPLVQQYVSNASLAFSSIKSHTRSRGWCGRVDTETNGPFSQRPPHCECRNMLVPLYPPFKKHFHLIIHHQISSFCTHSLAQPSLKQRQHKNMLGKMALFGNDFFWHENVLSSNGFALKWYDNINIKLPVHTPLWTIPQKKLSILSIFWMLQYFSKGEALVCFCTFVVGSSTSMNLVRGVGFFP